MTCRSIPSRIHLSDLTTSFTKWSSSPHGGRGTGSARTCRPCCTRIWQAAGGFPTAACGPGRQAEEPPPLPSVDLPSELERVLRDYEEAWVNGSEAALANVFTKDGFVLSNNRPMVRGRAAIQQHYADAGGALALRAVGFAVDDTVGYIVGAYGREIRGPDVGKYVLALRRGPDGRWLIAADIDNANPQRR